MRRQANEIELPRMQVQYKFYHNPAWWKDKDMSAPEYIQKEMLAEIMIWHINKGSIRARMYELDGTLYKPFGKVLITDLSPDPKQVMEVMQEWLDKQNGGDN